LKVEQTTTIDGNPVSRQGYVKGFTVYRTVDSKGEFINQFTDNLTLYFTKDNKVEFTLVADAETYEGSGYVDSVTITEESV
jgi:hypothetical protein